VQQSPKPAIAGFSNGLRWFNGFVQTKRRFNDAAPEVWAEQPLTREWVAGFSQESSTVAQTRRVPFDGVNGTTSHVAGLFNVDTKFILGPIIPWAPPSDQNITLSLNDLSGFLSIYEVATRSTILFWNVPWQEHMQVTGNEF
jgi:hypothetical protein